jgi:hypothetical protein
MTTALIVIAIVLILASLFAWLLLCKMARQATAWGGMNEPGSVRRNGDRFRLHILGRDRARDPRRR